MPNARVRSARLFVLAAAIGAVVLIQLPLAVSAGAATPTAANGAKCTIKGTSGADTLKGTSGKDVICGLGGNDKITGASGDDVIDGGTGNDSIYAGPGNDLIFGGTGSDTLSGDSGTDTVSYAERTKAVTASLDGVRNDGESGEKDLIGTSVENLTGGAAADDLTGSTTANVIKGGGGNDLIRGGAGADTMDGGSGSDTCDIPSASAAPPAATPGPSDKAISCSADSAKPFIRQAGMFYPPVTPLEAKHVTATARLTDNFSGVAGVSLQVVGPNEDDVYGEVAELSTGDEFDGTWRAEFEVPADAPVGTYELNVFAIDRAGNVLTKASGAKFDQTGGVALPEGEDDTKPTIATWDLAASFKKDGTGPADMIATAAVTDDLSGVASVVLRLVGPNGVFFGGAAALDEGDEFDGSYRLAFQIPAQHAAGVYKLVIEATDVKGNKVTKETNTTIDLGA